MDAVQAVQAVQAVRAAARPLSGGREDYDALLELIGDAQFVLLGEASHGTHDFYKARAEITKRLIAEKGFAAMAAEADWPDAYRVNRYVRGVGRGGEVGGEEDASAEEALSDFERFPQWMWRNADILDLVGWLRAHNDGRPLEETAGFYGLDLYSLYASIDAVIGYLDRVDPEAAQRARRRYGCFEMFEKDEQAYGYAAAGGSIEPCEDEVVNQLVELKRRAAEHGGHALGEDEQFFAEQNARVAKNAEAYYRAMFRGRDTHMAETLDALAEHLGRRRGGRKAKIVVWAHNSHLGDARATQMSERGELNLGQLVRERHADKTVIVGFTTYTGTVTAASDWAAPAERKWVRPGLRGSYEALLHEVSAMGGAGGANGMGRFYLPLRGRSEAVEALRKERLERFIGVIYRPETERWSHYYEASLPAQFDAVFHYDESRALEPLERTARWEAGEPREVPQTYPFAA